MQRFFAPLFLLAAAGLGACAFSEKPVPCPVCYEDEWSREAFPGQAKQHTQALSADELQANGLKAARMVIGVSSTVPSN